MASDEEYLSFLNQANEDVGEGSVQAKNATPRKLQFKAADAGAQIPKELKDPTDKEEWIYISDADEPFVPVSLKLPSSTLPDESKRPLRTERNSMASLSDMFYHRDFCRVDWPSRSVGSRR